MSRDVRLLSVGPEELPRRHRRCHGWEALRIVAGSYWLGLAIAGVILVAVRTPARTTLDEDGARVLEQVRRAPLDAESFTQLAIWLFRRGDVGHAVAATREAIRLEPAMARHYRLLGYLQAAAGNERAAEAAFREAAKLDPAARVSLADFYVARAWTEYQDALRRGPPDPGVAERLRALAALGGINPEVKALLDVGGTPAAQEPASVIPPIMLSEQVPYALVVEKRTQTVRLYGLSNGQLFLLQTYPCTTGQEAGQKHSPGDLRTPDGVYFIQNLVPGDKLPGIYGALAMPLNYPNAWDRRHGRKGYGIWIHGSNRLASPFTPRDTRGCVLMRNEDLMELARLVTPGLTPVLIAEDIPYQRTRAWQTTERQFLAQSGIPSPMALIATPDYTVVVRHAPSGGVVRDFIGAGHGVAATEPAALMPAQEWKQKLASIVPDKTTTLVRVRVLESPPSVVIETSGPAEVQDFRPEIANRLYLDLPGVRPAPMPSVVHGSGTLVKEVRVAAADFNPPVTRLVIDLQRPMKDRIATDGNRIVVSLSE